MAYRDDVFGDPALILFRSSSVATAFTLSCTATEQLPSNLLFVFIYIFPGIHLGYTNRSSHRSFQTVLQYP
jgi:hypothetical protein